MRAKRQVVNARAVAVPAGFQRTMLFLLILVPILLAAFDAFAASAPASAQNFENYAKVTSKNTNVLVDIFCYVSFIMGIVLGALGIHELRKHIENHQNPLKPALTKLGFGGMFLAFPEITDVVLTTMGGYDFDPFEFVRLKNAYEFDNQGAKAEALSGLIARGTNQAAVLVNVACFVSFIIGIWFTLRGVQMLRNHIDDTKNPIAESLKRLAAGGAMLSLPMIINIVYNTFGSSGSALTNTKFNLTEVATGSLDGMFVNLIRDISNPAYYAIEIFCYIAGVFLVLFALQRMVRTSQQGPTGPLGFGTISMFIIAGLLLSFPQLLATIDFSLFSLGKSLTRVDILAMNKAGIDEQQIKNAQNVFSAVLAFMAVIGSLAIVRGLFIFKSFADGSQQATMMSVVSHIVAGAVAVNLGAFTNAVQSSLGLKDFAVLFK